MIHESGTMPSCRQKGAPRAEECRFIGRREQETGSYTRLVANCRVTFFYRRGGTSQTGNLTSADQEIPEWFEVPFLGELKLYNSSVSV